MRGSFWFLWVVVYAACGGDGEPRRDAGEADASSDAGGGDAGSCDACDDGVHCNGIETCMDGACMPGVPVDCDDGIACTDDVCDEAGRSCAGNAPDADGDGYEDASCVDASGTPLGEDCDDTNPNRYPGAAERCDAVDQDCDPATFGGLDEDADGYVSNACCNGSTCGPDCNDARTDIHPGVPEVCDDIDNDCSGMADEDLPFPDWSPDCDGDLFGDTSAATMRACRRPLAAVPCIAPVGTPGWVDNATDCDDRVPAVNPAAAERCNDVDDDCNPSTFADDTDGDRIEDATCGGSDCRDADPTSYPGASEPCNGVDNDCSSGGTDDEDVDRDMHARIGAVCTGGYPIDDCNDGDATIFGGNSEVCDARDNDCSGAADDEPASSVACGATLPGARGECYAGTCHIAACTGTLGDCGPVAGCETDLAASTTSCGTCGSGCGAGSTCSGGECSDLIRISAGSSGTCALRRNGRVICWGHGSGFPAEVPGLGDAIAIASGGSVSGPSSNHCAVRTGGGVACWVGPTGAPVAVPVTAATQVTVGQNHACARTAGGEVWCWGANGDGELGDGAPTGFRPAPVRAVGLPAADEVDAGNGFTCARSAGTVRCWGRNAFGQLGDGSTVSSTAPVLVSGLTDATALALGLNHACALRATGGVACWGRVVGDGTTATRTTPVSIYAAGVLAVETRSNHTCVLRSTGMTTTSVECWGDNFYRQLGIDSPTTPALSPVVATGAGGDAVEIAVGERHTCTRERTGTMRCWGQNVSGELGDGNISTGGATPLRVVEVNTLRNVFAGANHSCVRSAEGVVWCWGQNVVGQLGDGSRTSRDYPAPVQMLTDAVQLAGGGGHTCAIRAGGTVACWGMNMAGQLGTGGTPGLSSVPLAVPGLSGVRKIAAGSGNTCALDGSGAVWCWGDGTTRPAMVAGLPNDIVDLDTSGGHTCVVRAIGTIRCWGNNLAGQLGDGSFVYSGPPGVTVAGITDAVSVTLGNAHTCSMSRDSRPRCWGANGQGQLGDGTRVDRGTPVAVSMTDSVAQIAAGGGHTCARLASGTLLCWGTNAYGQLGVGTLGGDRITPATVSGTVTRWTDVSLGDNHSCAMDGIRNVALCWGMNDSGQIGDRMSPMHRTAPFAIPL